MNTTLPTPETIRAALAYVSPDQPRQEWVKIGMAVKDGLNGEGFPIFDEWSKGGQTYNATDTRDTWKSIKADGAVTVGTLFGMAKRNGWKPDGHAPQETEAERQARERKRAERVKQETKTKAQKAEEAARKTTYLERIAEPARPDHPYLVRKGIKPAGKLFEATVQQIAEAIGYQPKSDGQPLTGRVLLAFVENGDQRPTVEFIDEQGRKSALAGGPKSGGYWPVQPLPEGDGAGLALHIGEGVATVLSVIEATGGVGVAALSASNLPKVAKALRGRYPAARLVILGDVGGALKYAEQAARETGATLAAPDFTGLDAGEDDTDFNDLHRLAGLEAVKAQITAASAPAKAPPGKIDFDTPVFDFPHVTETGRKRATIANLRHLFKSYGIEVSYDELLKKQTIRFNNDSDWGHGDLIDNAGVAHIRSLMALNGMPASALDLLPALFAEKASNPVLGWIESKAWDEKDRFKALADTLTVAESDQHYRDVALNTWLLQCVAAADGARRTPNKDALPKYELAFILQGGQGAKKTSWFKRLVPKHLSAYIIDGAHLDPADKETVRTCISSWICELGELDSTFRRADISRLKAFLSKQTDTLRLPYDRAESQFGRRTSFCGSVNPEQFLGDSTGSRRFLPLQVTACNSLHTIDMQQLWAQAWRLYLDGRQWWCNTELEELLKERHERHAETAPVDELIAEAFHVEKIEKGFSHRHFTATRILIECGIKEPKAQQVSAVNSYMKKLGFKQLQTTDGLRGYWLQRRKFQP